MHMFFGVLSLLIALITAMWVLVRARHTPEPGATLPSSRLPRYLVPLALIISGHVIYAITLVIGLILLIQLPVTPYWIIAKLILFVVLISSITKSAKTLQTKKQRLTGLVIADFAWISIIALVVVKPGGLI